MFYISKKFEISAAHRLNLSYPSKCENLHGHNWVVTVFCKARELNKDGMVVDFSHIQKAIKNELDHKILNDILDPLNPTAENLAFWIYQKIDNCYKVIVQESDGNIAIYEED